MFVLPLFYQISIILQVYTDCYGFAKQSLIFKDENSIKKSSLKQEDLERVTRLELATFSLGS